MRLPPRAPRFSVARKPWDNGTQLAGFFLKKCGFVWRLEGMGGGGIYRMLFFSRQGSPPTPPALSPEPLFSVIFFPPPFPAISLPFFFPSPPPGPKSSAPFPEKMSHFFFNPGLLSLFLFWCFLLGLRFKSSRFFKKKE